VLCPGPIEVLVFNGPETVPLPYRDRTLIRHSPQITDVHLDKAEMAEVGREVSPVYNTPKVRDFPGAYRGIRQLFGKGQGFYDPEADEAFLSEVKCASGRRRRTKTFLYEHPVWTCSTPDYVYVWTELRHTTISNTFDTAVFSNSS
jgi:uncharacterized protein (UPF0261 family)